MDRISELIYTFLDDTVGVGINITKGQRNNHRIVLSNQKRVVFWFILGRNGKIILFKNNSLCSRVNSLFSIEDDVLSAKIIGNWFADRNNINKVSELYNFIKED